MCAVLRLVIYVLAKNSIYYRGHPKVLNLDMLHTNDYSNMGLQQMNKKINESKRNDENLACSLQYCICFIDPTISNCQEILANYLILLIYAFREEYDRRCSKPKGISDYV